MRETVALAPRQALESLPVGHVDGKPDQDFEPTTPFGAGVVAASARDMVLFWNAHLSGRIVSEPTVLAAFARLYPMFDSGTYYGRGVMLYELPGPVKKRVWLGHSGGTPGLKSVVAYDVETGIYVAVAMNGNVSAEAAANKLLGVVSEHRARR